MTPSRLPAATHTRRRPCSGWVAGVLAVVALLAVFALYGDPDFVVRLADQMWACF